MAKHEKTQHAPRVETPPKAANVPAVASVHTEPIAAPMGLQIVRARLLSDTPHGRDLPFGLNGSIVDVSESQYIANSDILVRL